MLNPFEPPITPSVKIIGFQSTADGQVVGDYGLKAWAGLGCPVAYSLFPCRFCSRTPADGQVVGDVMGRANQAGRPGGPIRSFVAVYAAARQGPRRHSRQ